VKCVVYGLVETRPDHRYRNQVRYVGVTHNLENRVKTYRRGGGNNPRMRYWLKVCPDFQVIILAKLDDWELALQLEVEWIKRCGTYRSDIGMNYHPGGIAAFPGPKPEWSRVFTPEHRANISKAKKGSKLSSAHRAAIGASVKMVPHTSEWNAKVAEVLRNNPETLTHLRSLAQNKSPKHQAAIAASARAKRWQCAECGMKSNAGGIGTHQKGSGHVGRSRNFAS
jgi:predicted GIY-YIG superfamily endonuclease